MHDDYLRQGIGEALLAALIDLGENWLGLTRLELEVYTDNAPAIALYQKLGFVIEGTKRRYAMREGVLVDA
ncbi:MAG: GNAT family N-acetyltransferase, partial [Anaerolineae bacterium]